ncbi:MAG: 3-dehydroquinate synthase [Flavobacteriaceae bacterium]
MKKISSENSTIICNDGSWDYLNTYINTLNPSKIFVLTDSETKKHCLPLFLKNTFFSSLEIITIPIGEEHKTIDTCLLVWNQLSQNGADRQSVLLNLGGGVVTDLGGFVASTYQRGISFINIPTSLLAMVDASIGGKNGVDLGQLKNQIGIIRDPKLVLIDITFLNTLPKAHVRSGMAEMIKHGFISSEKYLEKTWGFSLQNKTEATELIWESIKIKKKIVTQDPTENGIRKALNYGHTLGHAIESFFLNPSYKKTLLHGEAIAIGLILETYISTHLLGFSEEKRNVITSKMNRIFPKVSFSSHEIDEIIKLLIFDKKNSHGIVQFVLLTDIGAPITMGTVSNDIIKNAFKFYKIFMAE